VKLRRSRRGRTSALRNQFVVAEGVARMHNVQFVKPKFVVDEVKWILEGVGT
jgi:hypothetical protein